MGNTRRRHPDEEWALAVWNWSLEVEEQHQAGVQVSIYRTARRGVLMVQLRAVEVVDGAPVGIRAQVKGEYPNSQSVNLVAYLGTLFASLDSLLTDYAQLSRV